MKRVLLILAVMLVAAPVMADYYVAGDFNAWDPLGNLMTDDGSGVWSVDLTGLAAGRHEFKVTVGDWSNSWPGSGNSWLTTDDNGNVTVQFNSNDVQDGWTGTWGRIGVSIDPGTWTAVGDWQGWDNANPATAMTPAGGGIYTYQTVLAPGTYQWKAVVTSTWDAIGNDFRSINADNSSFDVTADSPLATFYVNALDGTIKVETSAVPEPSSLLVLASGLPLIAIFRKRR